MTDENGAEITYALDAQYAIAEDIELTDDMLQWQLPEGFAGSITPLAESSDDLTLYDAQSDTIYLYNPYQMAVLHGETQTPSRSWMAMHKLQPSAAVS